MAVEIAEKEPIKAPRGLAAALREAAAAAYCGDFAPQTFRVLRHQGRGPSYYRVSGKIFYKISDLDLWLESCRVEPGKRRKK